MTLVQIAVMKSLALCSLAIFGLMGCGAEPLCSSEVLQVARDLGSDRYAVASVRDCGATTDYATVVRVGRASKPQSAAKEVFVADSDHGTATNDSRGAVWLSVVWTASGKLSIVHSSKARIFKHLPDAEGASVTYRASDPLSSPPVN